MKKISLIFIGIVCLIVLTGCSILEEDNTTNLSNRVIQNKVENKIENKVENTIESKVENVFENKTEKTTEKTTTTKSIETIEDETTQVYILNTNTKKFHNPGCSSISKMKESNKQEFEGTRTEAINRGYTPCQKCNP